MNVGILGSGVVGQTIAVGIRPESITAAAPTGCAPRVTGTVDFVEELGSEVLAHVRVAGLGSSSEIVVAHRAASDDREIVPEAGTLVAKLPAHAPVAAGEHVTLYLDPGNIHCFDPAGPSLRRGAGS